MEHFIKLYKKKKGKNIRKDNRAVQKLRREVEKAKRALSSQHQARIEIESLYDGEDFSEDSDQGSIWGTEHGRLLFCFVVLTYARV